MLTGPTLAALSSTARRCRNGWMAGDKENRLRGRTQLEPMHCKAIWHLHVDFLLNYSVTKGLTPTRQELWYEAVYTIRMAGITSGKVHVSGNDGIA